MNYNHFEVDCQKQNYLLNHHKMEASVGVVVVVGKLVVVVL
jgi:hypothetical protein